MRTLFLIIILSFICIFNIDSKDDYSYLKNDLSYSLYSVSIKNLNTKNMLNYFNNINVVRIYPKVNPIYMDRIGNVSYKLRSSNLSSEINYFRNSYLSFIKKNSYLDYNYLYINGVGIDKVDVYMSGSDLYRFLTVNDAYLR